MKPKAIRKRLDILLVERGMAASSKDALAMVLAGEVQVDGKRTDKAGTPIASDAQIEVTNRTQQFVSRGGVKLKGALADFAIDPKGCICLDIGSSTGGFTDCLLQHGASRVYAVDVNTEQIDWKLRQDPRVVRIERNARELDGEELPQKAAIVVIDVSFISASKVLGPAISEAEESADFVEFLGLAGLGKAEAAALKQSDIDWKQEKIITFRHKTKSGFAIPIYPQLKPLLLRRRRDDAPNERVFAIDNAKKAIANACRRLNLPQYSHLSFRRMFITRAIERGVDVKVIAEWQGHKDGGKLILDTYSHVNRAHSHRMAQLMTDGLPENVIPIAAGIS